MYVTNSTACSAITDQTSRAAFVPLGFNEEKHTMMKFNNKDQEEHPSRGHCPHIAGQVQSAFQEIWYGGWREFDTLVFTGQAEVNEHVGLSFEIEIRWRQHRLVDLGEESLRYQLLDITSSIPEKR